MRVFCRTVVDIRMPDGSRVLLRQQLVDGTTQLAPLSGDMILDEADARAFAQAFGLSIVDFQKVFPRETYALTFDTDAAVAQLIQESFADWAPRADVMEVIRQELVYKHKLLTELKAANLAPVYIQSSSMEPADDSPEGPDERVNIAMFELTVPYRDFNEASLIDGAIRVVTDAEIRNGCSNADGMPIGTLARILL